MQLLGFGEFHPLEGAAGMYARFQRADGQTFDLPISKSQLQVLFSNMQETTGALPVVPTPKPQKAVPQRKMPDEVEDDSVLHLGRPPSSLLDDDED